MGKTVVLLALTALLSGCCGTGPAQRTAHYLDSIRQQPGLLQTFLRDMPKGGDLHNHLGGAVYAESLLAFADANRLCVERATAQLLPCSPAVKGNTVSACNPSLKQPPAGCAYQDPALYNFILDSWSMRTWNPQNGLGHDHFFTTFGRFGPASDGHTAEMLAEVARLAAADHLQYLEIMHTADSGLTGDLAKKPPPAKEVGTKILTHKTPWRADFGGAQDALLKGGLDTTVTATRQQLDRDVAKMRSLLRCETPQAESGCGVTLRYLYQVKRGGAPEEVFAQILLGFELASKDPRFVGVNLVMPEDCDVCMKDFGLHMEMLDFLKNAYRKAHISLHAGELVPALATKFGLGSHIRDSVERGHAERIGHGVDIMNEPNPENLFQEMAQKNVLVEICLTSNDTILGVKGDDHPFSAYRQHGVAVALATDDEGVSRTDMTQEWLRAVQTYRLSYGDLKRMARQSLEHSFLPGASLWAETQQFRAVADCAADQPSAAQLSPGCQRFLDASERAREQRKLEVEFAKFEEKF